MIKGCFLILCGTIIPGTCMHSTWIPLEKAPQQVKTVKEIALVYNQNLPALFNALTPQERVFIYYIFRASLPGNLIAQDQSHRDAPKILELLEYIVERKEDLLQKRNLAFDAKQFLDEVITYLTYIWTNHSQYFSREHADEKRTPERLNLKVLNRKNLLSVLELLEYPDARSVVESITPALFSRAIESTMTVPGSIDRSAVNFYAPDFTDKDFEKIDPKGQTALNAYFYIDTDDGRRMPRYELYSVGKKYGKELDVTVYWLQQAYEHATKYPEQFDTHLVKSLEYLIDYFKTGDEQYFKKHSIEWLQSNSKIDYVFSFIET